MDYYQIGSNIKSILQIQLFSFGDTRVTIARILAALVVFGMGFVVSFFVKHVIRRALNKKNIKNEQTIKMTCSLVHWLIVLLGSMVALRVVGLDLSTLFAAGAVFTVGLGFAMQNIVQNFVSGVILFTERSIQPGDILSVDGKVVQILRIGIRATIAKTREEDEMIIPNSLLVQGTVTNYTMSDASYVLSTGVGVSYASDMKLVKAVLSEVAEKQPWRAKGGNVSVLMREFGDSSVNFMVYVEVEDPWRARRLAADLNESIWWALKEANITIAFPQLDVHLSSPRNSQ